MKKILFIFLLFLTLTFNLFAALFNEKSSVEFGLLMEDVFVQFEPQKHFFIGIGRSPAPIVAAITQFCGPQYAVNIPLTWSETAQGDSGVFFDEKNPEDQQSLNKLFHHFEIFLAPHLVHLSPKTTLVIMDFVSTGKGLYLSQKALEYYLKKKSLPFKVAALAFTINETDELSVPPKETKNWSFVSFDTNRLITKAKIPLLELHILFVANQFKPYAEYGTFRLTDPKSSSEQSLQAKNPKYEDLKSQVAKTLDYYLTLKQNSIHK